MTSFLFLDTLFNELLNLWFYLVSFDVHEKIQSVIHVAFQQALDPILRVAVKALDLVFIHQERMWSHSGQLETTFLSGLKLLLEV